MNNLFNLFDYNNDGKFDIGEKAAGYLYLEKLINKPEDPEPEYSFGNDDESDESDDSGDSDELED